MSRRYFNNLERMHASRPTATTVARLASAIELQCAKVVEVEEAKKDEDWLPLFEYEERS